MNTETCLQPNQTMTGMFLGSKKAINNLWRHLLNGDIKKIEQQIKRGSIRRWSSKHS